LWRGMKTRLREEGAVESAFYVLQSTERVNYLQNRPKSCFRRHSSGILLATCSRIGSTLTHSSIRTIA